MDLKKKLKIKIKCGGKLLSDDFSADQLLKL